MAGDIERRRSFAKVLLLVGIPHLALVMIAVVGCLALVFFAIDSSYDEGSDLVEGLMNVGLMFVSFAALLALSVYLLGPLGLTMGGYYSLKGTDYRKAVRWAVVGIVYSILLGLILVAAAFPMVFVSPIWIYLIPLGAVELFCAFLAIRSVHVIRKEKGTFRKK